MYWFVCEGRDLDAQNDVLGARSDATHGYTAHSNSILRH